MVSRGYPDMAQDITGREITYPPLVRMQNSMNKEPVMTTVGRGLVSGSRKAAEAGTAAVKGVGTVLNNLPRLAAIPAAGVANVAATQLQNLKNGINGTNNPAPQFEALTATEALRRAFPPMAPTNASMAPPTNASVAAPAAAPAAPAKPAYAAGTGLPSAMQIASDKSRATASQASSDTLLGVQGDTAQPTNIDVRRQANGVLSFSGSGGGGAVNYTGMPSWKSAQGGAGQGAVGGGFNLGEQNARMAVALQGIQGMDRQAKADGMVDAMASGAGGAVGVAQNKAAMQALGPLLERQMANQNATGIANTGAETTRRGQDLGLKGEMARVKASVYGTDVGAQIAREGHEIEKERVAVSLSAAKAKASGDPLKVRQAQLLELEYTAKTGLDANTGKPVSEAQRNQIYQRVLELKTPQTVVPYGGFGMAAGDE